MRIIVTGSNGQLGSEIKKLAQTSLHEYFFTDIEDLDLCNEEASKKYFYEIKPDYIINCAAYTAVDKAESDEKAAYILNADIPKLLGNISDQIESKLIHISTDYVFAGDGESPLTEEDPTNPKSVYGRSKLAGEHSIQEKQNTIIIRTAWLYSSFGNNFVKSMLRYMKEREELRIVNDQIGTPTYAADLAQAILRIVDLGESRFKAGIYHYSNEGRASWFDFSVAIKELSGSDCRLVPISSEEYPVPAPRPKYSIFAKDKIKNQFDIAIPDWKVSLAKCMKIIQV